VWRDGNTSGEQMNMYTSGRIAVPPTAVLALGRRLLTPSLYGLVPVAFSRAVLFLH
jgi:hypothetical protein